MFVAKEVLDNLLTCDNKYVILKETGLYEVEFYYDKNGKSEIIDMLDTLKEKSVTSKDARINREKILAYIGALEKYGTRLGSPYVQHIGGDIWELRPLSHRIFFFYWKDNKFVLLHHFVKKCAGHRQ